MIRAVFKHELRQQWRSKTLRLLLPAVMLLTALVAGVHWQQQQAFQQSQRYWQQTNDQLWQQQPDRHPHRVAHYGSLAFRLVSPLNFIDAGVNPYVGNALFLEAHRQNSAGLRQFVHSAGYLRTGYLSAATIVLVLWPLVLIALAFGTVSEERERGTLRLLLSLGTGMHRLLLGKGLVYLTISLVFLLFVFAIAAVFLGWSETALAADAWLRLLALFALYAGYCALWVAIILLVSWRSRTGAHSLLALLAVWLVMVVVLPRGVRPLAEYRYPAPDRAAFNVSLEQAIARIGDSHNPNDPFFNAYKKNILQRFGVESVDQLPVNWRGMVMSEGERISSEVYNRHYAAVLETFARQNTLYGLFSLLSPYMTAASLSARIAGSDAASFYLFEQQAELYRYNMIQQLNQLHTEKIRYENDRAQKISHQHWQAFDQFVFQPPELSGALRDSGLLLGSFAVWLLLAALLFTERLHRRVVAP